MNFTIWISVSSCCGESDLWGFPVISLWHSLFPTLWLVSFSTSFIIYNLSLKWNLVHQSCLYQIELQCLMSHWGCLWCWCKKLELDSEWIKLTLIFYDFHFSRFCCTRFNNVSSALQQKRRRRLHCRFSNSVGVTSVDFTSKPQWLEARSQVRSRGSFALSKSQWMLPIYPQCRAALIWYCFTSAPVGVSQTPPRARGWNMRAVDGGQLPSLFVCCS